MVSLRVNADVSVGTLSLYDSDDYTRAEVVIAPGDVRDRTTLALSMRDDASVHVNQCRLLFPQHVAWRP